MVLNQTMSTLLNGPSGNSAVPVQLGQTAKITNEPTGFVVIPQTAEKCPASSTGSIHFICVFSNFIKSRSVA